MATSQGPERQSTEQQLTGPSVAEHIDLHSCLTRRLQRVPTTQLLVDPPAQGPRGLIWKVAHTPRKPSGPSAGSRWAGVEPHKGRSQVWLWRLTDGSFLVTHVPLTRSASTTPHGRRADHRSSDRPRTPVALPSRETVLETPRGWSIAMSRICRVARARRRTHLPHSVRYSTGCLPR